MGGHTRLGYEFSRRRSSREAFDGRCYHEFRMLLFQQALEQRGHARHVPSASAERAKNEGPLPTLKLEPELHVIMQSSRKRSDSLKLSENVADIDCFTTTTQAQRC